MGRDPGRWDVLPCCPRSGAGPGEDRTGAIRVRFGQHDGAVPLVHQAVDRHPSVAKHPGPRPLRGRRMGRVVAAHRFVLQRWGSVICPGETATPHQHKEER